MKILSFLRLTLLALLFAAVPVSSFAGVFISVNFAPPILPVYEQPPCPDEGLMWIPGYWAYNEEGYFWVPGTWVPAPYEGALWTPPYWGWENNFYIFHPGYWGRHVGYYGGVNYGFGYMGVGFVGGLWRGHDFVYNRAVMRVDDRRIHNTYVDRTIVERNTIVNDRRVSFSGGRDGIHHDARPDERVADRDQHMGETSFQHSHESSAMGDRSMYVKNNGGRPSNVAVQRPLGGGGQGGPAFNRGNEGRDARNVPAQNQNQNPNQNRGAFQGNGNQGRGSFTPQTGGNNNPRGFESPRNNNANPGGGNFGSPRNNNPPPDNRNFNNERGNGGNPHTAPEFRQMPQQRPAPQPQPQQQPRGNPQAQPQQQPRGNQQPQQHDRGGDQHGGHGDHGDRPH